MTSAKTRLTLCLAGAVMTLSASAFAAPPATTTTTAAPAPAPATVVPASPPPASHAKPAGVVTSGTAVFPKAIAAKYASEKASAGRMHTCLDQYKANKASNGNGGMSWIQKGGGYYSSCNKKLKAG